MPYAPTRVLFGAGQLNRLHEQAGSKPLLVISSGKSVRENGALERTMGELARAGVRAVLPAWQRRWESCPQYWRCGRWRGICLGGWQCDMESCRAGS